MKVSILLTSLILNTGLLFPGVIAIPVKTDSVITKKSKTNSSNPKIDDGTAMLPSNDITTNIARSKELSTFYKTITITGFNESFKSIGPITVFAPSNQAFSNLRTGKLDSLLSLKGKFDLIALVSYHAIPGKITAKNIAHEISIHKGTATFITLGGSKLMAKLDENHNIVMIDENGGKSVINRFDIKQKNGLVHITDAVLIPKFKTI